MRANRFNMSRRSLLAASGAAAIGVSLSGLAGCDKPKKLNFYNWDTYIGDTTLADFEKSPGGVGVNMTFFANNDELFNKLKAGNPGFDVIVPSNDFVTRMSEANLLMPLDHSKIPNMKNIDPRFLNPDYDPGRKFSMPYTWLVLGIGYNKTKMKDMDGSMIPDSWKWVFESDLYKKKIAWLGESGDLIRLAGKYLGYSVNALDEAALTKIEALLTKQVGNVLTFHSDDGQDLLAQGDVDIVIEYNGDIAQKKVEYPDLDFVLPKEGSQFNSDTLAIPTGAPMPEEAHAFINFILDGQNGANIYKKILYPSPNAAATALMPDDYKNNAIVFPPADQLAKCEYAAFPGDTMAQTFDAIITRVRAAGGIAAPKEE